MDFTWKYGRSLATATTEDGDVISYEYNKDGIRTSKTINGTTTTYKLHGSDIVKETTGTTEKWYLYGENSELLGISINGVSYYYEKNVQGDIIGLIDSDGDTVVTYSYDAWGNVTEITGNETLASQNPFRYRGYYYDEEIGLYYLQSRYYDSEVGRFINGDDVNVMISLQSGVKGANLFEYCENNVVNRIDPTGKWSWKSLLNGVKKNLNGVAWGKIVIAIMTVIGLIWEGINTIISVGNKYATLKRFFKAKKKSAFVFRLFKRIFKKIITAYTYIKKAIVAAVKLMKANWQVSVILFSTAIITAVVMALNRIKSQ